MSVVEGKSGHQRLGMVICAGGVALVNRGAARPLEA